MDKNIEEKDGIRKESKDIGEENKEAKEFKEAKESKGDKVTKEAKESRESKEARDGKALKEAERCIEAIRKKMSKDQYYLRCQYAISIVEAKAKIIDEQLSMKYNRDVIRSVTGRIKAPESIYAKLLRKGTEPTIDMAQKKLNDLIGVRIVCLFLDDVYEIADILKKQKDIKIVKEKDYISKPKKNGYMSLHLIVDIPIYFDEDCQSKRVEIQIRTVAMDFWSVLEYQLMYKKNASRAEKVGKELKNYSEEIAALDQKMMNLRNKIDEI